uniref:Uncharacterized protein n=1 Tax=Anguilla anguilla TaxID=7936 RepID=A0A0E9XUE8_ANGAN
MATVARKNSPRVKGRNLGRNQGSAGGTHPPRVGLCTVLVRKSISHNYRIIHVL